MTLPDGPALLQIALRWLHVLAGVAWIGLLYFFNLVNVPFMKEIDAPTKGKVITTLLPRALWWFRWSAAVTWIVGFVYFAYLLALYQISHAYLGAWLGLAEEFRALGDPDGARSLAEEVASQASGSLKTKAQAFLNAL